MNLLFIYFSVTYTNMYVHFSRYPQQFICNMSLVHLIQCRYKQIKNTTASADDKCAKAMNLLGAGEFFLHNNISVNKRVIIEENRRSTMPKRLTAVCQRSRDIIVHPKEQIYLDRRQWGKVSVGLMCNGRQPDGLCYLGCIVVISPRQNKRKSPRCCLNAYKTYLKCIKWVFVL